MAAQFLTPAMSSLTVNASPTARSSHALAAPASRSCLGQNFAGAPSTAAVQIGWKVILVDVVQTLARSEPIYGREESMDGMLQARVNFRVPLNASGTHFRDISAAGGKCPTIYEAESEASIAALQELQDGRLSIRVVDVSRTRCKEVEKACYEILTNATAIYHQAKSLLINWDEDMHKAEGCYSAARREALKISSPGAYKPYDILQDVADKLADLTRGYYLKLVELSVKTEEAKAYGDAVHERVESFFREPPLHQANENRGNLPLEIKLSMKLVLQQLIIAIGWAWPNFNTISSGMSIYVCEISLLPNHVHVGLPPKPLVIVGSEADSEEEAVESSCEAAILFLEREKSICLVDLNYNHRSHGELYVVEAREAVQFASLMVSKVLVEWEMMVEEIHACEEYCRNLVVEQRSEDATLMQRLKYSSTKAVAELHEACLADLQLAKQQVRYLDI